MSAAFAVIVIGAGQAGLVMGYYLQAAGIAYVILGKEKRIGDVWRDRYDSLVLFTPRWMSRLPDCIPGSQRDPDGYADKNEIADELEGYAAAHRLNVQLDTEVIRMTRTGGQTIIDTNRGMFSASRVVIATGPFQQPGIPDIADRLSPEVFQVHTAHYKNKEQLRAGNVLIVGCGNSGAQIASELAGHRQVHLSASGAMSFLPREVLGRSIFWWFRKIGLYKIGIDTKLGRRISKRGDPVIGKSLKALIKSGKVDLHPRACQAKGNDVVFDDGTQLRVSNVIWATGYVSDYNWVHVPGVLDDRARPNHERGVSGAEGIYFLGLPWQSNRGSALIGGVAADAQYLLKHIAAALSS